MNVSAEYSLATSIVTDEELHDFAMRAAIYIAYNAKFKLLCVSSRADVAGKKEVSSAVS